MRFAGKTALVTGGASGIGLATVRRFAAEGAAVVIGDIDAERADAAASIVTETGGTALAVALDAGDPEQVRAMVTKAIERFGGVDIAVAGAGRGSSNVDFFDLGDDEWDAVLRLNLTGAFVLGKAIARQMLDSGRRGAIINIASVGGVLGVPTQSPYCVSKAGLIMLTKTMAVSLAPHGIRVNAVGPGPVDSAMTSAVTAYNDLRAMMLSRTPLGRFGEADEIASIVMFLASDEASYITGETIYADGGRLALNYVMAPPAGTIGK